MCNVKLIENRIEDANKCYIFKISFLSLKKIGNATHEKLYVDIMVNVFLRNYDSWTIYNALQRLLYFPISFLKDTSVNR